MSIGTEDAEATLKLAEAIDRLAAAIKSLPGAAGGGGAGGSSVYYWSPGSGVQRAREVVTGGAGGSLNPSDTSQL